jgi:hypothetical protein
MNPHSIVSWIPFGNSDPNPAPSIFSYKIKRFLKIKAFRLHLVLKKMNKCDHQNFVVTRPGSGSALTFWAGSGSDETCADPKHWSLPLDLVLLSN